MLKTRSDGEDYIRKLYTSIDFVKECDSSNINMCLTRDLFQSSNEKQVTIEHNASFYQIRLNTKDPYARNVNEFLSTSINFQRLENILNLLNKYEICESNKTEKCMKVFMQNYRYVPSIWLNIESQHSVNDHTPMSLDYINNLIQNVIIDISNTLTPTKGGYESSLKTLVDSFSSNIKHLVNAFDFVSQIKLTANKRQIVQTKPSTITKATIAKLSEFFTFIPLTLDSVWYSFCRQIFYRQIKMPEALNKYKHILVDDTMLNKFEAKS